MAADVEGLLDLARALLSPARAGIVFEDDVPIPEPGVIGAAAGFGRVAEDGDLRVDAYVFDEWTGGLGPMDELKAHAEARGRTSMALAAGPILLFATAGRGDSGRYALLDLSSRFSGPPAGARLAPGSGAGTGAGQDGAADGAPTRS